MKNITKIMCGIVIAAAMAFTCVACTNDKDVNVEDSTIATESTEVETDTTTEEATEETEETTEETDESTEVETNEDETETVVETNEDTTETIVGPTVFTTTVVKNPASKAQSKDNTIYTKTTFPQEDRDMGTEEEIAEKEIVKTENVSNVSVSDSDYILLCNAVAHEAGSNWISTTEKAKVAEVILNRVDSSSYPDSVYSVITQRGQFSSCWNYANLGGFSNKVTDDVKAAVDMALDVDYNNHGYTGFWGDGSQNHFH